MAQTLTRRRFIGSAAIAGVGLAAFSSGAWMERADAADGTVTLRFWKPPGMDNDPENKFFDDLIKKYQTNHPNVKVEHLILPWDSGFEKYTATFATKDVPDVTYQILPWLSSFESQGAIAALDDLGDVATLFDGVYEGEAKGAIGSDGKHYAVPYYGSHWVMAINEDIWEQAGKPEIPTTYDAITAFAKQMTFDEAGKRLDEDGFDKNKVKTYGYSEAGLWSVATNYVWNYLWAFGAALVSEDQKDIGFNNDQGRAALQWLKEVKDSGAMTPLALYQDADGWGEALMSGRVGMSWFERLTPALIKAYPKARIKVIDAPAGPAGQFLTGGAGYLAIPEKSQHKAEAFDFIKFLTDAANVKGYLRESLLYPVKPLGNDLFTGIGEPQQSFMDAAAPQAKYVRLTPVLPYNPQEIIIAEISNYLEGQKDLDAMLQDVSRQVQLMAKNAGA
ncbi:MAG TPA: sugar ABC transporter substrate-binding protein [Thermomicrobiales bacterium]|nr:sugar ABC transporter substrate-binding protein [Thermomicrobiales bacterium]